MTRFEFNDDALAEITQRVKAQLQPEVNAKGQDIVRRVNAEMAGEPVDDVMEILCVRMREAGFEPNDEGLRPYAQAISDGALAE
jgi:hypothetical protein